MPELTLESLGAGDDLTDRERLALAFGILREKGWFAPVEWSTSLCCTAHGWEQVVEHFGMTRLEWMETDYDEEPTTIWWHMPHDSLAFYGTLADAPMSEEMEERIDAIYDASGEDENAVAEWLVDHQDEVDADEIIERTTKLVYLISDLSLHWSGGMARMDDAVAVLRSVGLTVSEPATPSDTILVHPRNQPMSVKVRKTDGRLALWLSSDDSGTPHAVLSRADALGLIDLLRQGLAAPSAMRAPD